MRCALFCTLLLCVNSAFAKVEIQPVQHNTAGRLLAIRISEDIAPGDYETLRKGLGKQPGKFTRRIALLDSIGGSAAEAIRIGRLLHQQGFETLVPKDGICQGSCIYLLAAGHQKTVRGYVALHRPYYATGDSSAGGGSYDARSYLQEMKIPLSLIDDMQNTPAQRLRLLSPAELARYRLSTGSAKP